MKLTEFNQKPYTMAKKALKENFNTDLALEKLDLSATKSMLGRVRSLMSEVKDSDRMYYSSENNPQYLKLVFMEQALSDYYNELKSQPKYNAKIVLEDEAIEEAQVILAAKDMIDSIQKMIEDVSDMLVKELPAVVESVSGEKGDEVGEQFNSAATESLTGLQAALTQSKAGLQSALSIVKGDGMGFGGMPGMGADMGADMALFEFVNDDPLRVKLVAITDQLKDRYSHSNKPMSVDSFLQLLNNNDISVDISDLRDMISKEPLVNIIDDIKGDEVFFKGQKQSDKMPTSPDEKEKTVAKMAQRASDNR